MNSLKPPVCAKNRDALFEAVERFALHVDEGIVAALERNALRLVCEEVRHAAVGSLLGHDVHDPAVGQVPGVLERRPCPIAGEHLRLPIAMADNGLQNADFAKPVEDGAVAGARREPIGIERPELGEGVVVENELLFAIEDRDGRLDAVERLVVGGDLTIEFPLHRFDVGDVDRGAGRHAVDGKDDDVVRLALAPRDEVDSSLVALAPRRSTSRRPCAGGFRAVRFGARGLRVRFWRRRR